MSHHEIEVTEMQNTPGSEEHDVGLQFAAIVKLQAIAGETLDLCAILDFDFAVNYHLTRAHVYAQRHARYNTGDKNRIEETHRSSILRLFAQPTTDDLRHRYRR